MWLHHPDFHSIVTRAWITPTVGNVVQNFIAKTSSFQALAKDWNRSVYGNLFQRMKDLQVQLQSIQFRYSTQNDPSDLSIEAHLATELHKLFQDEEIFWAQKI